jgi:hypothetical protein
MIGRGLKQAKATTMGNFFIAILIAIYEKLRSELVGS